MMQSARRQEDNGGKKMNKNRMNLRLFDNDAQLIDRTGAESLIPVQESNEIIQGVVSQSAVLTRGKKTWQI